MKRAEGVGTAEALRWSTQAVAVDVGVRSRRRTQLSSIAARQPAQLFSLEWWLIAAALTLLIFTPGGSLRLVPYLAIVLLIVAQDARLSLVAVLRLSLLLALPLLQLLSTLWSEAPDVTLKQSSEVLLTFLTGIVLATRLTERSAAVAIVVAAGLVSTSALLIQRDAFSGAVLVAGMGSKNQVAFIAQIALAASVAVGLDVSHNRWLRLTTLAVAAIAIIDLALARSAGGLVTAILSMFAFLVIAPLARLSFGARVLSLSLFVLALIPIAFSGKELLDIVQAIQMNVLHKDATLTGRTALWSFAQTLIAERPILGHGAIAFWRQGNLDAEGLWQVNGIASRMGFNFHNQFLDEAVDLGLVGVIVLLMTLVYVAAASAWQVLRRPDLSKCLMLILVISFYSRLGVESTLVGPWNVFTVLWVMTAALSLQDRRGFTRIETRYRAGELSKAAVIGGRSEA